METAGSPRFFVNYKLGMVVILKAKHIINLVFSLALISLLSQGWLVQANSSLPMDRSFDWETAEYHRDPTDNLPRFSAVSVSSTSASSVAGYESTYSLPVPSPKAVINSQNIRDAIDAAATDAFPGRTIILFQDGVYNINQAIVIDRDHGNVTFHGSGNTTILLKPPAKDTKIFVLHDEGLDDAIVIDVILQKNIDQNNIDQSDIHGDGFVDALDIQMSVNEQLEMVEED